jgi:hypothetical protein
VLVRSFNGKWEHILPSAGPMRVPLKNQPSAVARSVYYCVSFER